MTVGSGQAPPRGSRADAKLVRAGDRQPAGGGGSIKLRRFAAAAQAGSWRLRSAEALIVFAIAIGARLMQLDHVPHKDELNHVLAARSLLENGTLEIVPDGTPYTRAWGFTYVVAGLFRVAGESLVVGRLPAVLAGAALVLLLFLWVRSEAGRVGAWFAALLLTFVPISLQLSQAVRFYTPHALFFLAGCLLVYRLLSRPPPGSRSVVGLVAAAVIAFGIAGHLHKLTAIGAGGLALWVAMVAPPLIAERVPQRRQRALIGAAAAGAALLVAAFMVFGGYAQMLLGLAVHAPVWAEGRVDDIRYYHQIHLDQYGPLWTLFPLAALLALAGRPRAALLAVCVFGVAFVTHSLVAWKQERYLFYAMPFFFALWGIAVGTSLPWLEARLRGMLRVSPARALPRGVQRIVVASLLVGVAGFAAFGTPAVSFGHKMLTVADAEWQMHWGTYRGEPDWQAAVRRLGPLVTEAEVVLGSHDVAPVYALGRQDYLLRRVSTLNRELTDFQVTGKTLAPVVSTPAALAAVMQCHRSGVAIIERGHWRNPSLVTPATVDFLEAHATPIPLPEGWRLVAYHWDTTAAPADPAACAAVTARP